MPPTHVYNNSRYFLGAAATLLLGVVWGLSEFKKATYPWVWACLIGCCVLGLCVCLWMLADRRPRLTFSDEGLTDRLIGVGAIAWDDIEQVYLQVYRTGHLVQSVGPQQYVCLQLRNEEDYLARMSFFKRLVWVKLPGLTRICVNARGLQATPQEIIAHINQRLEARRAAKPS